MSKKTFPLAKAYQLLGPGPVILVTTVDKAGRPNIMALAWQTPMDFAPPLVGIVMGEQSLSFKNLKATRECVINIPTAELAEQVVGCGSTSGRDTDKFQKFGLTPAASKRVRPPQLAECYASLECRVLDSRLANKYNFFILQILKAWVDPAVKTPKTLHHRGKGEFMVAGKSMLVAPENG